MFYILELTAEERQLLVIQVQTPCAPHFAGDPITS